jgi:putative ABC transport system ATP-binding protein
LSDPAIVALNGVSRSFDAGRVTALDQVSLAIAPGDLVAILGRSGSGKSCLVNLMAGLDRPSAGTVLWRGAPVAGRAGWARLRADHIGLVFQEFHLIPTLTAVENVEIGLFGRHLTATARRERAVAALAEVGLSGRLGHLPAALSGGERQRTAVARALARDPDILLADEPTGNLDSVSSQTVADLMLALHARRRMTLVVVTHDEALARRFDRQVRVSDGRIVEDTRRVEAAA